MTRIGRDVLPSHLSVERTASFSDGGVFDNLRLRIGEVKGVVYPDDDANLSKKFVEYSVFVQHRANNGTAVGKMYYHCVTMNRLAGFADQEQFALRDDPGEKKTTNSLGQGSKVLLLCVNGETTNAVILGGMRDSQDESGFDGKKPSDLGHYYHWAFNGARIDVNDDGELTLTYTGKTKIDGTVDSSVTKANTGGTLSLTKDGTLVAKPPKGVKIGSATDHTLLGESFRQQQKQLNQQLKAAFDSLQTLLNTAGAAITAAAAVPAVNGVAPSGFAPAGAALTSAASIAKQASAAIDAFEQAAGQKNSFLSQNNQSD